MIGTSFLDSVSNTLDLVSVTTQIKENIDFNSEKYISLVIKELENIVFICIDANQQKDITDHDIVKELIIQSTTSCYDKCSCLGHMLNEAKDQLAITREQILVIQSEKQYEISEKVCDIDEIEKNVQNLVIQAENKIEEVSYVQNLATSVDDTVKGAIIKASTAKKAKTAALASGSVTFVAGVGVVTVAAAVAAPVVIGLGAVLAALGVTGVVTGVTHFTKMVQHADNEKEQILEFQNDVNSQMNDGNAKLRELCTLIDKNNENKEKLSQECEVLEAMSDSLDSLNERTNPFSEWIKRTLVCLETLQGRARILNRTTQLCYNDSMIYKCLRDIEQQLKQLSSQNLLNKAIEFVEFSSCLNTLGALQTPISFTEEVCPQYSE